jgi:hypothetical protein
LSKPNAPSYLEAARAHYAQAFDHLKKRDLARSMEDWAELNPEAQSFTVAHLLYLNIEAHAAGQRIMTQVRDLLDELAESLTTAIEENLPAEVPEEDGPADDDGAADPGEVSSDEPAITAAERGAA